MQRVFLIALLLAGCVQLPPSPQDIEAKKFESLPYKSVIYIVRTPMDSRVAAGLWLDDTGPISTWPGSYYRWEVAPGLHHVTDQAPFTGSVALRTEAGKIYFVQHSVYGGRSSTPSFTRLRQIDELTGRTVVMQSELL